MARTYAALKVEAILEVPSWSLAMSFESAEREPAFMRKLRKNGFYAGFRTMTELQAFCEKDYNNSCPNLHQSCLAGRKEIPWQGHIIRRMPSTLKVECEFPAFESTKNNKVLADTLTLEIGENSVGAERIGVSPKLVSAINSLKYKLSHGIHGNRSSCLKSLNTKNRRKEAPVDPHAHCARKKKREDSSVSSSGRQQDSSPASSITEVHSVTEEFEFKRDSLGNRFRFLTEFYK